MHSTGYASMRITTLLATNVEGLIFPPLIIFKDKKIIKGNELFRIMILLVTLKMKRHTLTSFYFSNGLT